MKCTPTQVVVIGDNTGYPEGCSPHEVATLILQFFEAYNEGDQEQLASFFPPTFQWYSDTRVEVVNGNNEQIHIACRNQKIFVWSMGTAAPDEDEEWYQRPCTEPAGELSAMVCIEAET